MNSNQNSQPPTGSSTMHIVILQPTDVLFFRDGRPMDGSLAGHTMAWPLPDVINHAFHAALHRAGFANSAHKHRRGRSGNYSEDPNKRDRLFGCLKTAGPFPVRLEQTSGRQNWYFPRPKDAQQAATLKITHLPVKELPGQPNRDPWHDCSLPDCLGYAVANTEPPSKDEEIEQWLSLEAFQAYIKGADGNLTPDKLRTALLKDTEIADVESYIGIAIDPETQTTGKGVAEGKIYSAHYLRLREEFRLGAIAEAMDKVDDQPNQRQDLIDKLLNGKPTQILVGGQQRVCTANRHDVTSPLPLPKGLAAGFAKTDGKWLIKWVLLTPAIWPEIAERITGDGTQINSHPGGWLPNWIAPNDGKVLLTSGPGFKKALRKKLTPGAQINARLVAAIVPKPIVVTGWALPNDADRPEGGAKSTHLAVPAGAVYYFEADSEADAKNLANALNWHGDGDGKEIKNRRSTLLGEQGFGLGVCGTWKFYFM